MAKPKLTEMERLQRRLAAINKELATVQGLRRAGLYVKRSTILSQMAKIANQKER